MSKTEPIFRLGDTITGAYHDEPFTGTIVAFDSFGVSIETPDFEYLGIARDGIWLRHLRSCTLVSRPSKVALGTCQGVSYLRNV